ncbi:MAG: hypothetical protein K8J08_08925, partial [Thermoanaerobaculia bacterium]|nr:hypothetical protein [Thermoanaerobaculia bacterium]
PPPPLEIPARGVSSSFEASPGGAASPPPGQTPRSPSSAPSPSPAGPNSQGSGGGPPGSKKGLSIPLLAGAAILALLLVVLVFWMLGSDDDVPPPTLTEPITRPVTTEPVVEDRPEFATVSVVAGPWAEIVDILDAEGNSIQPHPGVGSTTPVRIQLLPAFYSIVLQHPGIEEAAVCQVVATLGTANICSAKMTDVDVTGYFKETGWWK